MMLNLRNIIHNQKHKSRISRLFSIGSLLDGAVPYSPEFIANKEHMNLLNDKLRSLTAKIYECGGEKALLKQRERGKLPVRERINTLLDQGSPFLEIGLVGGYEMYKEMWIPSGGIVTGIGSVNG
jgi:3-methylcrotonyl-CoA carboxylase beta subunit